MDGKLPEGRLFYLTNRPNLRMKLADRLNIMKHGEKILVSREIWVCSLTRRRSVEGWSGACDGVRWGDEGDMRRRATETHLSQNIYTKKERKPIGNEGKKKPWRV